MLRIALDLELESDGLGETGDIIQIGYTIFDTNTKKIIASNGDYVKVTKPLSAFITKLTKITQKDIDEKGIDIKTAYDNLLKFCDLYGVTFKQIVTWGSGDHKKLKSYIDEVNWKFGRTECNLKPIYQMLQISKDYPFQGGLKKSLKSLGINWDVYKEKISDNHYRQRSEHNAICDSINTAKMYLKLQERLQNGF